MSQPQKKNYSLEDFENRYHDITKLYDFAEELVATVESEMITDANRQLEIVEPLINEIGEATDVLAEEFIFIAESHRSKGKSKSSKARIDRSLRRLFVAINDYNGRVRDIAKKAHGALQNIADGIVQKIQRHLEEIVIVFLEFVHISLQSIMGHAELEALRVRDTRIAMMMHQHAMSQQQ